MPRLASKTTGDARSQLWRVGLGSLAAVMVAGLVGACFVDEGYSTWVLNDSSATLLLESRVQLDMTVIVPPHTYGALFEVRGTTNPGWAVSVVDGQCNPVQTWPADANHTLVYVSPTGERTFVKALAWDYGLRTATQVTPVRRDPSCP